MCGGGSACDRGSGACVRGMHARKRENMYVYLVKDARRYRCALHMDRPLALIPPAHNETAILYQVCMW